MVYLDTSALAKRYLNEPQGVQIEAAVRSNAEWLFTSIVTYAETLATLARALRDRRIARTDYSHQVRAFQLDWESLHIVDLTPAVLARARDLIERHQLRGFDAIHLCSALWVGQPEFACFDTRLRTAAAAESLVVIP